MPKLMCMYICRRAGDRFGSEDALVEDKSYAGTEESSALLRYVHNMCRLVNSTWTAPVAERYQLGRRQVETASPQPQSPSQSQSQSLFKVGMESSLQLDSLYSASLESPKLNEGSFIGGSVDLGASLLFDGDKSAGAASIVQLHESVQESD